MKAAQNANQLCVVVRCWTSTLGVLASETDKKEGTNWKWSQEAARAAIRVGCHDNGPQHFNFLLVDFSYYVTGFIYPLKLTNFVQHSTAVGYDGSDFFLCVKTVNRFAASSSEVPPQRAGRPHLPYRYEIYIDTDLSIPVPVQVLEGYCRLFFCTLRPYCAPIGRVPGADHLKFSKRINDPNRSQLQRRFWIVCCSDYFRNIHGI